MTLTVPLGLWLAAETTIVTTAVPAASTKSTEVMEVTINNEDWSGVGGEEDGRQLRNEEGKERKKKKGPMLYWQQWQGVVGWFRVFRVAEPVSVTGAARRGWLFLAVHWIV
jgi:hypothetical protein